jgi:5-methylcytosine-specific restriction protein A
MPHAAPRPCTHPGCPALVKKGRCEQHKIKDTTARQRQAKRALPTNSARWRRIRAAQLQREPLCADCDEQSIMTPATHVDHKDGDSHNNQPDNLQSLCASCHSRKTAASDGGFGNRGRGGRSSK